MKLNDFYEFILIHSSQLVDYPRQSCHIYKSMTNIKYFAIAQQSSSVPIYGVVLDKALQEDIKIEAGKYIPHNQIPPVRWGKINTNGQHHEATQQFSISKIYKKNLWYQKKMLCNLRSALWRWGEMWCRNCKLRIILVIVVIVLICVIVVAMVVTFKKWFYLKY